MTFQQIEERQLELFAQEFASLREQVSELQDTVDRERERFRLGLRETAELYELMKSHLQDSLDLVAGMYELRRLVRTLRPTDPPPEEAAQWTELARTLNNLKRQSDRFFLKYQAQALEHLKRHAD